MLPLIFLILVFYVYKNINLFQVVLFDLMFVVIVQVIIVFLLHEFVELILNDDHDQLIMIEYEIVIHLLFQFVQQVVTK
jgi:hypothetical protein